MISRLHAPHAPLVPSARALALAASLAASLAGLAVGCGEKSAGTQPGPASVAPATPTLAPAAEVKAASFTATIEAPASKAGETAHAVVRVVPIAGYKVNAEYPYKCKMDPASEGVTFPTPVVTAVDRTKELATMKLPYVAAKPGTARVGGVCSISVCTAENCVIEKVALVIDAKVD